MKTKYIISIIFILFITPLVILSFYNHPAADDYSYALKRHGRSIIQAIIYEYNTWGGRYFSTFFLVINPLVYHSFFVFKLIPILLMLSFILSSFFLFMQLTKSSSLSWLLSFVFFVCYVFMLPDINAAFYWLPGSATYLVSIVLFQLFFGIQISLTTSNNFYVVKNFGLILLAILIIGCNEVSMIYILVYSISMFCYKFFIRKKFDLFSLLLVLCCMVFTYIEISAPGAKFRASQLEHITQDKNLILSLIKTFKKFVLLIARYNFLTFCLNILLFILIRKDLGKIKVFRKFIEIKYWKILLSYFIIIGFLPNFMSIYSLNMYMPARALNVVHYFSNLLIFILSYKLVAQNEPLFNNVNQSRLKLRILTIFFSILFIYSIIANKVNHLNLSYNLRNPNNLFNSYYDLLSQDAKGFSDQQNQRYKTLENGKGIIYLKQLKHKPNIIYFTDLKTDSSYFYNQHMTKYFGKKIIVEENK